MRKAAEAGHEVVSLSRGIQGTDHAYPIENIRIDLVLPEDLTTVLQGVDVVVHAAGILRELSRRSTVVDVACGHGWRIGVAVCAAPGREAR